MNSRQAIHWQPEPRGAGDGHPDSSGGAPARRQSSPASAQRNAIEHFARITPYLAWLVLAGLCGLQAARMLAVQETGPRSLVADPATLHFGERYAQDGFRWAVRLRNTSREAVAIMAIDASCPCTSIAPQSLRMLPGETREIQLTLDLRDPGGPHASPARRDFAVTLSARSNTGMPLGQWQVTGRVVRLLQVEPQAGVLRHVRGEPPEVFLANVASSIELSSLIVSDVNGPIDADLAPDAATPGNWLLHVAPIVSAPRGRHRCAVGLQARTVDGQPLPKSEYSIDLEVVDDLRATPGSISLGRLSLGEVATHAIVVDSPSGARLEYVSVEVAPEFECHPESVVGHPDGSWLLTVQQRCTAVGAVEVPLLVRARNLRLDQVVAAEARLLYFGVGGTP